MFALVYEDEPRVAKRKTLFTGSNWKLDKFGRQIMIGLLPDKSIIFNEVV